MVATWALLDRRYILALPLAFSLFFSLYFTEHTAAIQRKVTNINYFPLSQHAVYDNLVSYKLQPAQKRLTLIALYGGSNAPTYLPLLVQTAAQNADSVDLLLINPKQTTDCLDLTYASDIPNFTHICLSDEDNAQLIIDWICSTKKKGCADEQTAMMMAHLMKITKDAQDVNDVMFTTFKPWRGLIYKQWVKTEWWAWFDTDQVVGNFASMLPWDIINNFDIITTSGEANVQRGISLNGPLTLFRNSKKMEKAAANYPAFLNLDQFQTLKPGIRKNSQEQGEYADYYINQLSNIDILRIPDFTGNEPGVWDRRVFLVDGHIINTVRFIERLDIQDYVNRLDHPLYSPYGRDPPTFTKYGQDIPIYIDRSPHVKCNGDEWNPINACPSYHPSYGTTGFLIRKNGEWRIRREPRLYRAVPHEFAPIAIEPFASMHWLYMKYRDNFTLPNFAQTGFNGEVSTLANRTKQAGDRLKVIEFTTEYWATWTMIRGSKTVPRGYEETHLFKGGNGTLENAEDWSWKYHHHQSEHEIMPKADPQRISNNATGQALMVWDVKVGKPVGNAKLMRYKGKGHSVGGL